MQNDDLFSIIENKYDTFTTAEKKIANYVEAFSKDVLYLSISDLAESCNVGDATVSRFCKSLNLNGYQEFKMLLAQSLSNKNNYIYSGLSEEIKSEDTVEELSQKVLMSSLSTLNETFQLLNFDNIKKCVDMISSSRIISFFGAGSSGSIALDARDRFARIIPNTCCILDSHMQLMEAALMTKEDLAIAFSYSGSTKNTIDILKLAKNNGTKTICITRFRKSPITEYADITLLCGSVEGPLQGGALSTKIAQLYIVDILYSEFFKQHNEICQKNKEKTTKAISSKLL